jgi:hypothetical protein
VFGTFYQSKFEIVFIAPRMVNSRIMSFFRQINVHPQDVDRLLGFLRERQLSARVAWDAGSASGAGVAGRVRVPILGKGIISGQLSEEDAKDLNRLIAELEDGYFRPR